LQEFDGAFRSCRKSLQRHRNSQSRRNRKVGASKTSSGSDEFSAGGGNFNNKRTSRKSTGTGAAPNTDPNSSINDTEGSNNDQSPYNGSDRPTQSIDGSFGSGMDRQQCGVGDGGGGTSAPGLSNPRVFGFPPGSTEPLASAALNNSNNTTSAAEVVAEGTPATNGITTNNGLGPLPIPCTKDVPSLDPSVLGLDLLLPGIDFNHNDIITAHTSVEWIPDLTASDVDGLMLAEPPHHQPRLAPLPIAVDASAGHARAMSSVLFAHQRHQSTGQPTTSGRVDDVSNCSLDAALNLVRYEYPHTLSEAHDGSTVVRASLKLFNTRPEHLPLTVREALMDVVAGAADTFLDVNTRPGCVHITANAVLKKSEAQAFEASGARGLLTNALAQGPALIPAECMEGPRSAFLSQINNQIAALGVTGTITSVSLDSTQDTSSEICAVVPLAMTTTEPHHVTLLGKNISGDLDMVVCRRGEITPNLGVLSSGPSQKLTAEGGESINNSTATSTAINFISSTVPENNGASGSGTNSASSTPRKSRSSSSITSAPAAAPPCMQYPLGSFTEKGLAAGEYVQFSLMDVKEGLHNIEIQKGSMLSPTAQSMLVINDSAVVAEIRQLEVDSTGVSNIPAFVQAVGIIVEHLKLRRGDQNVRQHPNASIGVAQRIIPLAASIVTVAIARKWPALLRLVCSAASPADVQTSITAATRSSSTTTNTTNNNNNTPHTTVASREGVSTMGGSLALLHMVAASGCVDLVEALADWGHSAGHVWLCQPTGSARITPLHIAAILDDNAAMASALTDLFGTPCHQSWYFAKGADGITPAHAAKIAGNDAVIEFLSNYLPSKEDIASQSYLNDDSTCSSLYTTGESSLGDGVGLGADKLDLHTRKCSSSSFEYVVPPCPDEWPYSTFYGTSGLLVRSAAADGGIASMPSSTLGGAEGATATTYSIILERDSIKGAGLCIHSTRTISLAISFITGVAAMAMKFYNEG
jgi:hypothetical protein